MSILVAVASKHGATRGIGEALVEELCTAGLTAELHDVTDALNVNAFDAVVVGSAVYMGGWLPEARDWIKRNQLGLVSKPVWLFSSGPLGDDNPTPHDPGSLPELLKLSGAREHRVFAGKLEPDDLSRTERIVARVVHAPYGDFRDWPAIHAWGREIAVALNAVPAR